jgi:methylmalonyl-CoA mutase N-terminal domain/subunit
MAAILGGTQSLHCNGKDEALALPTEEAARLALRTQQIIAAESGAANTVDPFGGAYAVEQQTDSLEEGARAILDRIDRAGGTLAAIETGLIQREIHEAAYRAQQAIENGTSVVVGVNRFETDERTPIEIFQIDPEDERRQIERTRSLRSNRDQATCQAALQHITTTARSTENLMPPIIAAVEAHATLGEIAGTLRGVFGEYREATLD